MNKNSKKDENGMSKGASPIIFKNAQELRERMTVAEERLWERLKGKKLGLKFRRQHPILNYIADFYCHELKLIIEIDGGYHNDEIQQENDLNRTKYIEAQGLSVIRFSNEEVLNSIETVINKIREIILKAMKVPFETNKEEKSPYNPAFVVKIEQSRMDYKEGKGIVMTVEELNKLWK